MRVAFYYSHHESLGHTTRVAAILEGLVKHFGKDIDILIIHAGSKQKTFNLERYGKVLDLPFAIKNAYSLDIDSVIKNMINKKVFHSMIKRRIELIKNNIMEFKPDIFVTEFFPFGRHAWYIEIPPILNFIKKNAQAKTVCSVGYPEIENNTYDNIKRFYDFIIFHCTKIDVETYKKTLESRDISHEKFTEILDNFADKIFFTNYVIRKKKLSLRNEVIKKLGFSTNKKFIVFSRGGGTRKPDIIPSLFTAKRLIKDKDLQLLISTGPATEIEKNNLYSSLAKKMKNIKLVNYLPDFENYLNAADLSINMSGYNTAVRLLWLKKQNICIPALNAGIKEFFLEKEVSIEQLYRAKLMENMGISKIIDPYELDGKILKTKMVELLENPMKPNSKINKLKFNGIENTVKIIEKISSS